MQLSIIRQTPAVSILLTLLLVSVAFVRFALAPYGDELVAGQIVVPGAWVDGFQSSYPVWGWILSAVLFLMNAIAIGKVTTSLNLYPARTTISIPLFIITACGIFISADSLSVGAAIYCTIQMLRHFGTCYIKGTHLKFALFAGLYAGLAPLFYAPTVAFVVLLPLAIVLFGFSWREIIVMITGLLLPLATTSYIDWLLGGEFLNTSTALWSAITTPTGYTPWASESVVALTMMGLMLFIALCGITTFVGEKRSVAVRPRTIFLFLIVTLLVACAAFALPSATAGLYAMVAIPISTLAPLMLLKLRDEISNLVILILVILLILHSFVA